MTFEPRLLPLGDAAATVTFGDRIDPQTHELVLGLSAQLALEPLPGVIEWVPAFASVTLWYDPDQIGFAALRASLAPFLREGARKKVEGACFVIPFCHDADLAPDLTETAALKNLSPDQYIDRFAGVVFEVAMLGFQPGFAYLGGLPDALDAPRLATPRKNVPARSVAIADGMVRRLSARQPRRMAADRTHPSPSVRPAQSRTPCFADAGRQAALAPDRPRDFRAAGKTMGGGFLARCPA
jgi:inhibitor of KinA